MKLIPNFLPIVLMSPVAVLAQSVPFEAPDLTPSQMDFGGVGLMQMPTARMSDEGEFNFSVTGSNEYLFYNVTLQVLPWLESTIRYTKVRDLPYSSSFPGVDNDYTDKGIDFKIRLMQESQYLLSIQRFSGNQLFRSNDNEVYHTN